MTADALDSAKAAATRDDVSASLMHGQIASVEALRDLAKIGAGILAQLDRKDDIESVLAQEPEALAAVLREADELYLLGTHEGRWEFIARRALEWLNFTPATTGVKK